MHRIDNPSAVQQLPTVAPVGLPGYFFNGDPRRGVISTQLDQDFFNAIQEEIAHVIETAGLALDKTRFDQLLLAIILHIQRNIPPFPPMPFLPLVGGTMQGPIYQHIWPTLDPELVHKAFVDYMHNAAVNHANAQDNYFHNEAVNYANARAIQEGDRAQNNAWTWDQAIWDRVNWIDVTQGGAQNFYNDGLFVVPPPTRTIEVYCTGAGGGGGGAHGPRYSGGGGGAGATAYGTFPVLPGQQFWMTVGQPGAPGGGDGSNGISGGASQFGDWIGGQGGVGGGGSQNQGGNPAGGAGGDAYGGGQMLIGGGYGADGTNVSLEPGPGGHGGASFWGGGGRTGAGGGLPGKAHGSGGGGGYMQSCAGGWGATGVIFIRWNR